MTLSSDPLNEHTVADMKFTTEVKTCPPTHSVAEAVRTMQKSNVGSIVILENDKIAGIFTERDFLLKLGGKSMDLTKERISSHMTPNPVSIGMDKKISWVMLQMRMGKFRHVLVQDENKKLKGVVSIKDILDHVMDHVFGHPH